VVASVSALLVNSSVVIVDSTVIVGASVLLEISSVVVVVTTVLLGVLMVENSTVGNNYLLYHSLRVHLKLDSIRVSLDYVMRCEARISSNRLFGKRRIIISMNEYEIYLVLGYFRGIGIYFSRNQCVQKRYISISCS
jgi:hypothetical protein